MYITGSQSHIGRSQVTTRMWRDIQMHNLMWMETHVLLGCDSKVMYAFVRGVALVRYDHLDLVSSRWKRWIIYMMYMSIFTGCFKFTII